MVIHMGEGLSKVQVKLLTYLVYLLITFLTISNGWMINKIFALEKGKVDHSEFTTTLNRVEDTIDKSICRLADKLDGIKEMMFQFHLEKD